MMNAAFPQADGNYDQVVPLLKSAMPSFVSSPEYALISDNDDLPGVVLCAYGQFLARLSASPSMSGDLEKGLRIVQLLHGWSDPMVRISLRDEFVESFDGNRYALRAIRPLLEPPLDADFVSVLGSQMSE